MRVCGIKSRSAWRVTDSAPWGSMDISTWGRDREGEERRKRMSQCFMCSATHTTLRYHTWHESINLLPSISQFVEGISGDDVATDELHGWIALWGLLPEDRTGEHRVVPALLPQVNFNLRKKKKKIKRVNQLNGGTELKQRWKFKKTLTGSSSLCVQTPLHCLCSITCLMFMSTGKAIQPDAKL